MNRILLAAALALFPSRLHRWLGCRLLGWDAHPTAYVGHSVIAAKHVVLGPHSAIGHFNMIKGVEELSLGDHAVIGFLNWISGPSLRSGMFPNSPNRRPALLMGPYAAILHRHIVDCSDTVTFGQYATLGGWRSTLMTHGVDLRGNEMPTAPVSLGDYALVYSNCVVLSSVPARTVVAAGSVASGLEEEGVLYRGNPATAVRDLPDDLSFFARSDNPR